MDIERAFGVDVQKSLCVLNLSGANPNDDLVASFATYGKVTKVVRVGKPDRVGQTKAIVEFDSDQPINILKPDFPCYVPNVVDATVTWLVDSVNVLTKKTDQTVNQTDFVPLDDSSSDTGSDSSDTDGSHTPLLKGKTKRLGPSPGSVQGTPTATVVRPKVPKSTHVQKPVTCISSDVLNPSEIQRIVVEHVIKNDTSATSSIQGSKWLKSFSGRIPRPAGEADFETWCLHVQLMFQDRLPIDVQRRKILESLLPPASDVKQLGLSASPQEYVDLLDSAYGLVEDGDEIFAKFLNTYQNSGEKASDFLQRLQILLSSAVKRNGLKKADSNRQLLKQFTRGCWDQSLLLLLQLESKPDKPEFAQLLLQIRTEEDRRAAKLERLQRHLGSSRAKPFLNVHTVNEPSLHYDSNAAIVTAYQAETEDLRRQVAELKMQLSSKKSKKEQKAESKKIKKENEHTVKAEVQAYQTMPKPQPKAWFCFKCGGDGHIARQCVNPPNKDAVDQKYKELKAKQNEWKLKYGPHLN